MSRREVEYNNGVVYTTNYELKSIETMADGVQQEVWNPMGGTSTGPGFTIHWKDGPGEETEGAQIEDVVEAARQRTRFFQQSRFNCPENSRLEHSLDTALLHCKARNDNRKARGVEGRNEE